MKNSTVIKYTNNVIKLNYLKIVADYHKYKRTL